jgi:phospho-2-dehydro-3-deoxyheptonate aldolase
MPMGFKNSTDGTVDIAIDACKAARSGHCFLSVGREGLSSIVETEGNPDVHIILRGGNKGPNFEEHYVSEFAAKLAKAALPQKIMVCRGLCRYRSFLTRISRSIAVMVIHKSSILVRYKWRRIL